MQVSDDRFQAESGCNILTLPGSVDKFIAVALKIYGIVLDNFSFISMGLLYTFC